MVAVERIKVEVKMTAENGFSKYTRFSCPAWVWLIELGNTIFNKFFKTLFPSQNQPHNPFTCDMQNERHENHFFA